MRQGGGDSKCLYAFLPRLRCFTTQIILSIKHYLQYTAWFFNHIFKGDKDNPQIGWMMMISTDIWSSVLRH